MVLVNISSCDLYDYIFNPKNNLCISSNGTIFKTDKDGIIPQILARWFTERMEMQAKQKEFQQLLEGIEIDDDLASQLTNFIVWWIYK